MNTPLHYAAYQGHVQICKTLVSIGSKTDDMGHALTQ